MSFILCGTSFVINTLWTFDLSELFLYTISLSGDMTVSLYRTLDGSFKIIDDATMAFFGDTGINVMKDCIPGPDGISGSIVGVFTRFKEADVITDFVEIIVPDWFNKTAPLSSIVPAGDYIESSGHISPQNSTGSSTIRDLWQGFDYFIKLRTLLYTIKMGRGLFEVAISVPLILDYSESMPDGNSDLIISA